jgi:hypothetical protein
MLHERFAKTVSVILHGSKAWNHWVLANATQLPKYRMSSAHLQQKLSGRWNFPKLRFS